MAKTKLKGFDQLKRVLNRIDSDVENIIKATLLEYMQKIYSEAMSLLPPSAESIRSSFVFEVRDGGFRVSIYTDNEFAAYIEFGTGEFAKDYLSGKPEEMVAEAFQFFVSGDGKMPERPYLFKTYYKYREELILTLDRRIQTLLRHA